jgi:hypothetical protein
MLRIPRSKPVTSKSAAQGSAPPAWRGPVTLLLVPGALIATIAFSCHDKDAIWIVPPGGAGTGGAPGVAGTGGTGNGGNGGSNMAGAAGSSAGGTAGSGNGGNGGSAGSSSGGSAGTGTAGTTSLPGDAGLDGGEPDSGGPQLTAHQQRAAAICAKMEALDPCQSPAATCMDDIVTQWDDPTAAIYASEQAGCGPTVDAYFACQANASLAAYDCNAPGPEWTTGGPECQAEEAAFFDAFANPCN